MKTIKILLIAVLFMAAYSASAQTSDWYKPGSYLYYTGGNVGIGTATPTQILHISVNAVGPEAIIQNSGGTGGAGFSMIDNLSSGYWKFKSTSTGGFKIRDQASALDVIVLEKNALANCLYIKAGGNVGIGTNNPQSKLAVNGKITCKEVEVTLTGWPDYVFGKDYKLSPLSEVENYIKVNGHLPGISSASEIENNGLSLGEMNKQLMQKVEELTLYVIQLQKEVNSLK
jgi:hypothetical protein